MSRHRLAAALAALATALAVALPASAATSPSTVTPAPVGALSGSMQSLVCPLLVAQLQIAATLQSTQLANLTGSLLLTLGCGGPAI